MDFLNKNSAIAFYVGIFVGVLILVTASTITKVKMGSYGIGMAVATVVLVPTIVTLMPSIEGDE